MKKIAAALLAVIVLLCSCGKEPREDGLSPASSAAFAQLLASYDAGRLFAMAEAGERVCTIVFEDGSRITVPSSAFAIHDHTQSAPPVVEVSPGMSWWSVGGMLTGIKALSSDTAKEDAEPVYVYYDSRTLYVYVSNRQVLTFDSIALQREREIARRQNIPVVHIDTEGVQIADKENYVDGTITVCDPERLCSDVGEFTAAMGIRGRGNSTWSFPKKPWKVKLREKASLLGMPADKEWCLLANYADRTLLRNVVAMKLSEICGFSWTPRMHSVEVYLNGEYQGVYTLAEHKKVSADRVAIDVAEEGDGSGEALTGGYYMEIEQQQDETVCWWTGMGVPLMFSEPEEPSQAQIDYVKQYFADFEASLYGDDFADPQTGYARYIDVESFIDYFIVQELTKNTDGNLRKSSFIVKERGKKMEMYHLWDFDLALGNSGGFLHSPEGFWVRDYTPGCVIGENWFNRMFRDPAFAGKVRVRLHELLPQLEKIPGFIDEQALYLDKAQIRNFGVWNIWDSVDWVDCPSLGSYGREVDFLKDFYTERLQWMLENL